MHRKLMPFALVAMMTAWLVGGESRSENRPQPASAPLLSQHETEALDHLSAELQAKLLLERAVNQYQGALEEIEKRLNRWAPELKTTPELERLLSMAYNHNDLRIREAAIDVSLVAHKVERTPAQVEKLRFQLETCEAGTEAQRKNPVCEGSSTPWRLWMLGLLAHKGIDQPRTRDLLLHYAESKDENTRYWAVESLAYMGTPDVVDPLLRIMHDDLSGSIRERAACGLAQSGMLTSENRQRAVPELIRYTDDFSLDAETRKWAFQALRDITGESMPEDPTVWRNWLAKR